MQAMMEQIALTESEAEQIRMQAAAEAKELIARAKTQAEKAIVEADEREREKTKAAQQQAQIDGAALCDALLSDAKVRIVTDRAEAEKNIPSAVKYLVERVETLA